MSFLFLYSPSQILTLFTRGVTMISLVLVFESKSKSDSAAAAVTAVVVTVVVAVALSGSVIEGLSTEGTGSVLG